MPKKVNTKKIIKAYNNGMTPTEIGKKFNIYANSVNRIIRKNGGQSNQAPKKVSQDKIDVIISRYIAGESSELIAKDLGVDGTTICRILKRNDISIRPSIKNKRKYVINENYFKSIDNQDKAYFLGFLYSDGNVSKEKNDIKISLKCDDDKILKKLSYLIYNFDNIHYYNYKVKDRFALCANLNITSQIMKNDLINLGCMPNKTFEIRYPNIEQQYDRHFIRGYFDGDGCFSTNGIFDITSNVIFLKQLAIKIKENVDVDSGIYISKDNPNTASLQIKKKDSIRKIFNFMYDDANLFLQRKYDRFVKYLELLDAKENKLNDKDALTYWFDYFRRKEFPFPKYDKSVLVNDWNNLCNLDVSSICKNNILISYKNNGLKIIKHFSPHIFSVKSNSSISMIEAFNNDNILVATIKNRVEQGFTMSDDMLRQGLRNGFFAFHPSIFYPSIAKYIYQKYCKQNDVIYDYSMGFGQRMLACLSLNKNIKYIGCDPFIKNIEAGNNIINMLCDNNYGIRNNVVLNCIGSENYVSNDKINLAFSSPPYFNKEIYSGENTQAYYYGYDYFINNWWQKTCENINIMLDDHGYFILNMTEHVDKNNILNDMLNICKKTGFIEYERYYIKLSRNTQFRKRGKIKLEPIIVMKKEI